MPRQHRYAYLLATQLTLLLVYPFFAKAGPRPPHFAVFLTGVMYMALFIAGLVGRRGASRSQARG